MEAKYGEWKGGGGCGVVRNYLYVYNGLLVLSSVTVLGLGVWTMVMEQGFLVSLLSGLSYPLTAYLLAGAGLIGILGALIGACAIAKSDRCLLLIFIFLLLLVFLLQVMGGTLAYIYREEALGDVASRLNVTLKEEYGLDVDKTSSMDEMQGALECCGSGSYLDWAGSRWALQALEGGTDDSPRPRVPDSCCKSPSRGCGVRDHPSNIYYTGCIHGLSDTLRNHLAYLTIAGLGLCILQVIGIIFSTSLYIKLKDPATPTQL